MKKLVKKLGWEADQLPRKAEEELNPIDGGGSKERNHVGKFHQDN